VGRRSSPPRMGQRPGRRRSITRGSAT
jgi:hypothetical protein